MVSWLNVRGAWVEEFVAWWITPGDNNELFLTLSEDKDIAITSLDEAKDEFLHKDLANINEKRSLLQALWLYVSDTNVIEDAITEDVKLALIEQLAHAIEHNLSDADIYKVFPLVYGVLYPQSE